MRSRRVAWLRGAALLTAAILVAGCQTKKEAAEDSAAMAADTGLPAAAPATAGPLPAVTGADAGLVMDASEFPINDENFQRFVRASEALSYLRARDMNVRAMLEQAGTTPDSAAGSLLERLEKHPQVSQAIGSAGMTVRDYYVMSIAVASAQRHAADPAGAPPTPVGRKNAEWAQKNHGQLAKLQTWGTAVAQ